MTNKPIVFGIDGGRCVDGVPTTKLGGGVSGSVEMAPEKCDNNIWVACMKKTKGVIFWVRVYVVI